MAISRISDGQVFDDNEGTVSVADGDMIVVVALGYESIPSLASGFTNIAALRATSANTDAGIRVGYRIASGTLSSTGTWTNAGHLMYVVLRGFDPDEPIGDVATDFSNSLQTSVDYPPLTKSAGSGMWFFTTANRVAGSSIMDNAPTGFTNIAEVPTPNGTQQGGLHSSEAAVTGDFAGQTISGAGVSANWVSVSFEVLAEGTGATPPPPTLTESHGDIWVNLALTNFVPHEDEPTDTLVQTRWQVTTDADTTFATPLLNVLSSSELLNFYRETLTASTAYRARARMTSNILGIGDWSNVVEFTTEATIPKADDPTLSEVDTGTDFIEVEISVFNHPNGDCEPEDFDPDAPLSFLQSSEIQIRLASDPNWNTPLDTIELPYAGGGDAESRRALFDELTANTAYKLRGRQFDGYLGQWTDYSADFSKTTDATPADAPLQPSLSASCGRATVLTGGTFAHSTSGVHTKSQWLICIGSVCRSEVTSDPSKLTSWTWTELEQGAYSFKVRYQDEVGRWGPYSSAQLCTIDPRPEPPVFTNPAPGEVISTSQTVTWEAADPEEVGWTFDGELLVDTGSFTSVFTDQASASYILSISGIGNVDILFRVRSRNPTTDETGEWSYLPLTVDRTGSRSVHYHFAGFSAMPDTWRQIWSQVPGWSLKETHDPFTDTDFRVGLMAINDQAGTSTRRSGLVFDELGEPDEFDITVVCEHIPGECTGNGWRFANSFVTRGGTMFFGVDGAEGVRSGRATMLDWGVAPWGFGPLQACSTDAQQAAAAIESSRYAANNTGRAYTYGRASYAAQRRAITYRTGAATASSSASSLTSSTSRAGGAYVYTDEYLVLGVRRKLYTIRQRVRRGVQAGVVGWFVTTQIFGPGLAYSAGNSTFVSASNMPCGGCGLSFEDMDQIGMGRSEGILFTDFTLRVLSYGSCVVPEEEIIGCEADWDFTIFEDDDMTPWYGIADEDGNVVEADFYDDRACPRPYLKAPHDFSETEIDFPAGASTIGAIRVGVVDKRLTPSDQDTGIVTARIGEAVGRRAVLRRWREDLGMVTVFDGVIDSWSMDSSAIVTYWFNLRDPRERERNAEMFDRNETFALYPTSGPIEAYGELPEDAGHLLSPAQPQNAAEFDRLSGVGGENGVHYGVAILSEATTEYIEKAIYPWGFAVYNAITGYYEFQGITVRWRLSSGGDWHYLRDMPSAFVAAGQQLVDNAIIPPSPDDSQWRVFMSSTDTAEIPTGSVFIDLQILAARTTETTPFFWDGGTFGDLAIAVYDGEFTRSPPRIRFNRERFEEWALETPRARFILYEPVSNLREWVQEHVYAPIGWAPSFDEDMRIVPMQWEMPQASEELVAITPDWVIPVGEYSYESSSIINRVKYTYITESVTPLEAGGFGTALGRIIRIGLADIYGEESVWTRFVEEPTLADFIFAGSSFIKEGLIEYKPVTVREISKALGPVIKGTDTAAEIAQTVASNVLLRFGFGAAEYYAGVRSGMAHGTGFDPYTLDLEVGQWIKLQVDWLPEFSLGRRNHYRYMQIKSISDPEIHYRRLRLVDGGPVVEEAIDSDYDAVLDPLSAPSWDYLSETEDLRVEIVVEFPADQPSNYKARVDYAVSLSEPNSASGEWKLAGYMETDGGSVFTAVIPAGSTVWIRARGEAAGRRPSEWTDAEAVIISQKPGLLTLAVSIDSDTGVVTLEWTPNAYAEGLRIRTSIGLIGHTASMTTWDDVDSDTPTTIELTGLEVEEGEEIYVEITAYPVFSGGNVSGTAGSEYVKLVKRPLPSEAATHALNDHSDTNLGPPSAREDQSAVIWDTYTQKFILGDAVGGSGESAAGACVTDTSVASATTTPTAITWTTEVFDDAGFFDSGANTRFTVPTGMGGLYIVRCVVRGNNDTSAHRLSLALRLNGTTTIEPQGYQAKSDAASSFGAQVRVEILHRLADGDYVEALLSANATTDMLDTDNAFWICRVGGPAVVAGTFEGGGSGDEFPDDPTTGMIWWRTDLLRDYVWNGSTWVPLRPVGVRLTSSSPGNAGSADATVPFDAAEFDDATDTGEEFWASGDPNKITMPWAGLYSISFSSGVTNNSTASRFFAHIRVDGATTIGPRGYDNRQATTNVQTQSGNSFVHRFTAGQYIEVRDNNLSGSLARESALVGLSVTFLSS